MPSLPWVMWRRYLIGWHLIVHQLPFGTSHSCESDDVVFEATLLAIDLLYKRGLAGDARMSVPMQVRTELTLVMCEVDDD